MIIFSGLERINNVLLDLLLGSTLHKIILLKYFLSLRFCCVVYDSAVCCYPLTHFSLHFQEYEKLRLNLQSKKFQPPPVLSSTTKSVYRNDGNPLHVYTDIPHVEEFLTRPEFVLSRCLKCQKVLCSCPFQAFSVTDIPHHLYLNLTIWRTILI